MNRIFVEKNKNYTVISNVFLRDNRLSLREKGFLSFIMSLPDDWDFSIKSIISILPEGEKAIYSIINILKDCGYCEVQQTKNEKGLFSSNDYIFYESPHGNPHASWGDAEQGDTVKAGHINTNITKYYNIQNKENIKKEKLVGATTPTNGSDAIGSGTNPTLFHANVYTKNNNAESNKVVTNTEREKENEFINYAYSLYPSKCPLRGVSLGKTYKDKERLRKLLKTYSMGQIEGVIKHEVSEKLGKSYLSNFSTFLNNFPDPECLGMENQQDNAEMENKEHDAPLQNNGVVYR